MQAEVGAILDIDRPGRIAETGEARVTVGVEDNASIAERMCRCAGGIVSIALTARMMGGVQ